MDDAFEALDDPSDDMEEEVEAEVDKVLFELTQGKQIYLLLAQPPLTIMYKFKTKEIPVHVFYRGIVGSRFVGRE